MYGGDVPGMVRLNDEGSSGMQRSHQMMQKVYAGLLAKLSVAVWLEMAGIPHRS
jgi:hypothetical protein